MEPIQNTFAKLMQNENFKNRYEVLKEEVMAHPRVKSFIEEHQGEVTMSMVERSLVKLYEYIGQSVGCEDCSNLESCKNMIQGYEPKLIIQGKMIDIQYDRCVRKVAYDERKKHEKLVQSVYMPSDILQASMESLDLSDLEPRIHAIRAANEFLSEYEVGKKVQALYFYGSFGVGKTYLLGAIANELALRKISSMIVYLPEFLREIKSSLQNNTISEKIDAVKRVPVLMLDDIGAEAMSSFVRDDVLGAILQFRMLENLPTFFTSNFDFKQLEHHLTYTQRGEEEEMKAARIMERIKYLAKPIPIGGKNRRHT
ncbi:primosomal protein DnaI [Bacillus multifaciens]|uniref:primosomal protein DnaI n=1 Tax=Bacillus multifaciens TaxID=3068506 RepID=UPI0027415E86|nr:primosomal protein DnaI [Bacillus sp. WLY-B-L8]MDP7977308.1 primosomal protein DnaI [Bacillus sp. WLY-B-L8]HDX9587451.1 primosomal protein DnaI [Bacillus pseudomycoides]